MIYPSRAVAGLVAEIVMTHFSQKHITIKSFSGLGLNEQFLILACWRRLKIDHPYRLKIDQGKLLYSVLYSIEIVDQTELVLNPFFY
jgi:hypothetical protein